MIDAVSRRIAARIKSAVPEHPRSEQVLAYSISFLLSNLSVVLLTLFISLLLGKFVEAAIALFSFAVLRQVSGGYHFKSAWLCIVISTAVVISITYANYGNSITILLTSISLLLALLYAPSRIDRQTRIPKKYFPLLRVLSVLIIFAGFLIGSSILTTAFFVQCLSLVHLRRKEEG